LKEQETKNKAKNNCNPIWHLVSPQEMKNNSHTLLFTMTWL